MTALMFPLPLFLLQTLDSRTKHSLHGRVGSQDIDSRSCLCRCVSNVQHRIARIAVRLGLVEDLLDL